MRKEFDSIKRKYRRKAVLYGAAAGVVFALAVTGALLIALKIYGVKLDWYFYLAIGAALAVICGILAYLLLMPSDKKLAKKLDKEYSLDEKTQTMVEYGGKEGAMLDLQRKDTEKALASVSPKKPSALSVVLRVAALVVAVALFVTGVAIKGNYKEEEKPDPYTVDTTKIELLRQLISDVEGDTCLDGGVQGDYLEELNGLLTYLTSEDVTSEGEVEYVTDTMYSISDITIAKNTYDNISYAISEDGDTLEFLADALRSAAKAYNDTTIKLTSYDQLGDTAVKKMSSYVAGYIEEAGESFTALAESLTYDTVISALAPYISSFEAVLKADGLTEYYNTLTENITFGRKRGDNTSGDALYDRVYDLYYTFYTASGRFGGTLAPSYTTADEVIKFIIGDGGETDGEIYQFNIYAGQAMETQAYTYLADDYIRYTLGVIFGVTMVGTYVDDGSDSSSGGGSGDDDGGEGGGGGGGTGETLYANNDEIYNPNTGEYTPYHDMLTDADDGYLAKLLELLDSDDVSEEVKNYIQAYINNIQ
ncbi:MAG: hypothetical protein LUD27_01455 [Clostridia bacterium]|nr:hypothetical protein [Clostridia bacterium]